MCSINHIQDGEIIGKIERIHEEESHYRVSISRSIAEKFLERREDLWEEWEEEDGHIWLNVRYARKICRLSRNRGS